mmetsp:Transcript_6722/g.21173  ORF Transcript_6722/g.21173 Transcript_6722/m.21173 type:complete len:250 (-) Transcript_6722:127-876(-)
MSNRCCEQPNSATADVESVHSWLIADAPSKSTRPYAPVDTQLPDPELLDDSPPLLKRVPRLLKWAPAHPFAFVGHLIAYGGPLAVIFLALTPLFLVGPAGARETCIVAIVARCALAFSAFRILPVLYAKYVLYQNALVFSVWRKVTLAGVTIARLEVRRMRGQAVGLPLFLLIVSGVLAKRAESGTDCLCGRSAATPFSGAAEGLGLALTVLAAALPFCYYVLWCFAVDPVEEVSIREKMKQQHVHTSG